MESKKIWLWGLGFAIILLTLLGLYGENFSLLGESESKIEVSENYETQEMITPQNEGQVEKVYDASLHLRSKPLKDPFHTEGIAKISAEMEKKMNLKQSIHKGGITKHEKIATPILYGVATLGNSRNAILAYDNDTINVKEGDKVGKWIVVSIGNKTIEIANDNETKTLTID